jgi:hypothetical protein
MLYNSIAMKLSFPDEDNKSFAVGAEEERIRCMQLILWS